MQSTLISFKNSMARIIQLEDRKIYQIKISLEDSKPLIWRRFLIPAEVSLATLHRIVQIVMGWTDSHMHEFKVGEISYGEMDGEMPHVRDQNKTTLEEIISTPRKQFSYHYDFGDSWHHTIVVEKITSREKDSRYPLCIGGERACPPEDCGGIWGYEQLLKAIKNPKTVEGKELLEWAGDFDPLRFELDEINAQLKKVR